MKEILKTMWNNGLEKDRKDAVLMFIAGGDRDMSLEVLKGHIDYLMEDKIRQNISIFDLVDGKEGKENPLTGRLKERFNRIKETFANVIYTAPDFILKLICNDFNNRGKRATYFNYDFIGNEEAQIEYAALDDNFNDLLTIMCLYGVNVARFKNPSIDLTERLVWLIALVGKFVENSPEAKGVFEYLNEYFKEEKYYKHIIEGAQPDKLMNYDIELNLYKGKIQHEIVEALKEKFIANEKGDRYKLGIDNDGFFKNVKILAATVAIIAARYVMIKFYEGYVVDEDEVKYRFDAPIFSRYKSYEADLRSAINEIISYGIKDGFLKVEKKIDEKHFSLLNYAYKSIPSMDTSDIDGATLMTVIKKKMRQFRNSLAELRASIPSQLDFLNNERYTEVVNQEMEKFLHIIRIFPKMFYFALNDGYTDDYSLVSLLYRYIHNYVVSQENVSNPIIFTGPDIKLIEDFMVLEGMYEEDELLKHAVRNINDLFEELPPTQLKGINMYKVFYDKYFEYKEGVLYGTNKHFNETTTHFEAVLRLTIMDLAAQVMAYHNTIIIHEEYSDDAFNINALEGLYMCGRKSLKYCVKHDFDNKVTPKIEAYPLKSILGSYGHGRPAVKLDTKAARFALREAEKEEE